MTITQSFSAVYRDLFTTEARYIDLWGGRSRGASYAGTDYFLYLITQPEYFRGCFMRDVHSDVRQSLWQDFKDRIQDNETIDEKLFLLNESTMSAVYLPTGNTIMSKGFKKSAGNRTAKVKSMAGFTHVLIEETEEISKEDFMQMDDSLRTTKAKIQIIRIFNPPPKGHWLWENYHLVDSKEAEGYFEARQLESTKDKLLSIFSTYEDNISNINPSTVANFEHYRTSNPDYYWTIVKGLVSEGARGRIYRDWQTCSKMPGTYQKFYGLDWGFSGDPLAMVECERHNRKLWIDQKIYKHGLTNDDLAKELYRLNIPKSAPIYADSAQPKDIEDMRRRGYNFIAALKGPGSVRSAINYVKQFEVFVTESSKDILSEVNEYAWALDQHKNPTDDPIDRNNHAMDAIGYAMDRLRRGMSVSII